MILFVPERDTFERSAFTTSPTPVGGVLAAPLAAAPDVDWCMSKGQITTLMGDM